MILLTFLLQTIRIAIPYLLAAAGGVMSERVGIIALGLEGMMLAGAFGAALGSYYGGSPWIGLAGALAAGAMVTALLVRYSYRRSRHVRTQLLGRALRGRQDRHKPSAIHHGNAIGQREHFR